jgi:hypothetical protein
MKATDLVKLMRKVVREEVRSVVQQELTEILREGLQSTIAEIKQPKRQARAVTQPAPPPPKRTAPIVTFDGPMGDLLNETAMGMMSSGYQEEEEWPDMNGGPMTAAHVPQTDPGSLMAMMNDEAPLPASSGYGDPTMNFVKDYSAVMKAADAHANGGR